MFVVDGVYTMFHPMTLYPSSCTSVLVEVRKYWSVWLTDPSSLPRTAKEAEGLCLGLPSSMLRTPQLPGSFCFPSLRTSDTRGRIDQGHCITGILEPLNESDVTRVDAMLDHLCSSGRSILTLNREDWNNTVRPCSEVFCWSGISEPGGWLFHAVDQIVSVIVSDSGCHHHRGHGAVNTLPVVDVLWQFPPIRNICLALVCVAKYRRGMLVNRTIFA